MTSTDARKVLEDAQSGPVSHEAGSSAAGTHDRLVRELAVGARAALAFVECPNSPEARYSTAIEQGHATARWITRDGLSKRLDATRSGR
jgi:hypothetical protein